MPALRWNKCTSKYVACAALALLLLYVPTNVLYVLTSSGKTSITSTVTGQGQQILAPNPWMQLPVRLKDLQPKKDGTVDLVISLHMKELFQVLDKTLDKGKEEKWNHTENKPPMNTSFVLHNPLACAGIPDLQYVIYVPSAPANVARRFLLRTTWASDLLFKKQVSKLVFMMGKPRSEKEQRIVDEEHQLFGDIVQGDFIEDYKNLTLKAIMGLKWVSLYCKQAAWAIKADDDAFVNIFRMMEILEAHRNEKRVIVCAHWVSGSQPILRDPANCMKWCVKYHEFPGRAFFPTYCAGLTHVMSRDIIPGLVEASYTTPFFWIDDVYVTGTLTPKVPPIKYVDIHKNLTLKQAQMLEEYQNPDPVTHLFSHVKGTSMFKALWNATLNRLTRPELSNLHDSVFKQYPHLKGKLPPGGYITTTQPQAAKVKT